MAVFENCEALVIQLLFPLLPLAVVEFLKSATTEAFEFFIGLTEFSINNLLVGSCTSTFRVLIVSLVPAGVATNSVQSKCSITLRGRQTTYSFLYVE